MLAWNSEIEARVGGAGRRNVCLAEQLIAEHFVHPAIVGDGAMQIELCYSGDFLAFHIFIQIEFQRALQGVARHHECAVAFIADSYIFERRTLKLQVGMHVFKIDALHGRGSIASVCALHSAAGPAASRAASGTTESDPAAWSTGSTLSTGRAGHLERFIHAIA